MPKITNEQEELLKSKIKDLVVIRSKVSAREVGKALGIDKDYAQKLIKQVLLESKEEIDETKVKDHLAQTNLAFNLISDRLFAIAVGQESTTYEKVSALREAGKNRERQSRLMFDAGIFKRKIGSLSIEGEEQRKVTTVELLEVILGAVDFHTKEFIVNTVSDYFKKRRTSAIPS